MMECNSYLVRPIQSIPTRAALPYLGYSECVGINSRHNLEDVTSWCLVMVWLYRGLQSDVRAWPGPLVPSGVATPTE